MSAFLLMDVQAAPSIIFMDEVDSIGSQRLEVCVHIGVDVLPAELVAHVIE
jgi:ATP-dependent 26S proteasome regulatory subunit